MQALETTANISNHRLVVENATLPDHVERARVIILWDTTTPSAGPHTPPPALAGVGREKGDILAGDTPAASISQAAALARLTAIRLHFNGKPIASRDALYDEARG